MSLLNVLGLDWDGWMGMGMERNGKERNEDRLVLGLVFVGIRKSMAGYLGVEVDKPNQINTKTC